MIAQIYKNIYKITEATRKVINKKKEKSFSEFFPFVVLFNGKLIISPCPQLL